MATDTGIRCYCVTLNGVILKRGFTGESGRREAERMAERWQGSHSGNTGLLKHKDRGDYVEVRRDYEKEQDYAERFDAAQRGSRQTITVQYDDEYTP